MTRDRLQIDNRYTVDRIEMTSRQLFILRPVEAGGQRAHTDDDERQGGQPDNSRYIALVGHLTSLVIGVRKTKENQK